MSEMESRNKRIAKNTIVLYFRMLLTMVVGLYTSRVILHALGVDDFGIYNVIGGVVAMFSIVSASLSATISRFITFELGKNNIECLEKIFSSAIMIQLILSIFVIILAESVGSWFLNSKMSIPPERLYAANWVMHFSVLTFCINLISVPYNATIVAHEKMSAFAYISIFEACCKLGIAYAISLTSIDRLIFYAMLMSLMALSIRLMYGWYCKKNFRECKISFHIDKTLFKQMFSFAGWNFIGSSSSILRDHGGNIIINLFCGTAANAARGIAIQVNGVVYHFVQNFMMALNPQITKSFASGEKEYMMTLIYQGAKLGFYMIMFLSLPILINTDFILNLWLVNYPSHTSTFIKLILIFTLSESISHPLITVMLATGNIRNYQIVVGGLQIMNLPVSYIFLRNGFPPETVFCVAIFLSQLCFFARLVLLKNMINLNVLMYLKKVYFRVFLVLILSSLIPLIIKWVYFDSAASFMSFFILTVISIVNSCVAVLFVGCNKAERLFIFSKLALLKEKIFRQ